MSLARQNISRLVLFILIIAGMMSASPLFARNMTIATGGTSGIYYPFGGGLASIWSKNIDNINMKAEVTGGSVANVIQVHRGESEAGIAMGNVVMAAKDGKGKFPYPLDIAVLTSLYPNLVHIIALEGSGINNIEDLKGKKVSLGAPGSGTAITATNILKLLGIKVDGSDADITAQYLSYAETTNALRDGNIDAGFIVGGVGVAALVELSLTRDINLISLSEAEMQKVVTEFPAYTPYTLPEGVYEGVSGTYMPSVWNVLVVHNSLSDDDAYNMLKNIYEHQGKLKRISHAAEYTTPENAYMLRGVKLHSGAERYLNEIKFSSN